MFKTQPLSSLKSIFPPVHQPLPLNKRQSQQLLNALTASFRKHLDREHGWLPDEQSAPPVANPALSYYTSPAAPSSKEPSRRPTDRHLQSILSNPLFTFDSQARGAPGLMAAQRDPMDVFDEAVSKGMMTMKGALGCLIAVRRDILQSSTVSTTDAMRASGAGLRVLQWLRSSGMERDLAFISNPKFVKFLLPFMIAEGLDELAWTWLARLIAGEGPTTVQKQTVASFLLNALVYTKSLSAKTLDDAYASILRGEAMLRDSPAFADDMLIPWKSLAWLSTVEAWKYASPSENMFESYVAISEHIGRPRSLFKAHLDLHHPTKPDGALAFELLSRENFWQRLAPSATKTSMSIPPNATGPKPQPSNFHVRIMSFGLDTVQHLSRKGQSDEAQWILNLLRAHLGPYFSQDHSGPDSRLAFG